MVKEAIIRHENGKWVVRTHDGSRVLGTHDTREDAEKQLYAIEINKKKSFNSRTASEVNWQLTGPCTGDKNCRTCAHFDELLEALKPQASAEGKAKPMSSADKKQKKSLQSLKKRHQEVRKNLKSAAVSQSSLQDFHHFINKHNNGYGTPWRVQFHGEEPTGIGHYDEEPHHIVVLHNPSSSNSVRLYDHNELGDSNTSRLSREQVWNIANHHRQVHDFMNILDRDHKNVTLNLADTGLYSPNWPEIVNRSRYHTSGTQGFWHSDKPSEVNVVHPTAFRDQDKQRSLYLNGINTSPRSTLIHELVHKDLEQDPKGSLKKVLHVLQTGVLDQRENLVHYSDVQDVPRVLQNRNSNMRWALDEHLRRRRYFKPDRSLCSVHPQPATNYSLTPLLSNPTFGLSTSIQKLSESRTGDPDFARIKHGHGLDPVATDWGPLHYAMMATSVGHYGNKSLHEYLATHGTTWKMGRGYNKTSAALAHQFGWGPSGDGREPVEDPSTIFDDSCGCHHCFEVNA